MARPYISPESDELTCDGVSGHGALDFPATERVEPGREARANSSQAQGGSQMKSIATVVIVAGLGLTGCAGISSTSAANCDGTGACKVDVAVTNCVITPTPDSLTVTGKNINIFWELDNASTASFRFRDTDGVKLKQPDSDFDEPQSQANGKKFKLHNKNSKAAPGQQISYPYMINVQRFVPPNWVDCPPLDPVIINKG
jgi:hypothetical protein